MNSESTLYLLFLGIDICFTECNQNNYEYPYNVYNEKAGKECARKKSLLEICIYHRYSLSLHSISIE
jgi:hypothetical protein